MKYINKHGVLVKTMDKEYFDSVLANSDYSLDYKYLIYATELLREIASEEIESFQWLFSIKEFSQFERNEDAIIELLNIFENIIDLNTAPDLEHKNINRIMSQLVNIIKLSKMFDKKAVSNIKYHLSLIKNEVLNPEYIPSAGFSQEGEDLIIKRLLPADKKGFFVDIGAHHPIRFSNTYLFYKMGWRGINIDPRPGIMDSFDIIRPEDINLELAIGEGTSEEQSANYISFKEPAYNSVYVGQKEDVANSIDSEIIDIRKVSLKSLDEVLEEHSESFTKINLLSIDVEGFEMQVLNGFTIEKYKPDIIVVEVRGFDISTCDSFEEYNLLVKNGYKLRSVLYHSLIFENIN